MYEFEKQELYVENWGRTKCEELDRIWKQCYPTFCSIPYGEEYPKNHTKEEVFEYKAKEKGFTEPMINEFLSL